MPTGRLPVKKCILTNKNHKPSHTLAHQGKYYEYTKTQKPRKIAARNYSSNWNTWPTIHSNYCSRRLMLRQSTALLLIDIDAKAEHCHRLTWEFPSCRKISPTMTDTITDCARRALVRTGSLLYMMIVRLYTSATWRKIDALPPLA